MQDTNKDINKENLKKKRRVNKSKTLSIDDLVFKRSEFLKANFGLVKLCLVGSFLLIAALSILIYFILASRSYPPVYSFDGTKTSKLVRLKLPKISNEAVIRWSSQTISDIFTFNVQNVDEHLENIKIYFTEESYKGFIDILNKAGFIRDVREQKLIYKANSCDVVSITDTQKLITKNGNNTLWRLQIPIAFEVQSASAVTLRRYVITAIVEGGTDVRADKSVALIAIKMKSAGDNSFCVAVRN